MFGLLLPLALALPIDKVWPRLRQHTLDGVSQSSTLNHACAQVVNPIIANEAKTEADAAAAFAADALDTKVRGLLVPHVDIWAPDFPDVPFLTCRS